MKLWISGLNKRNFYGYGAAHDKNQTACRAIRVGRDAGVREGCEFDGSFG
jgi:hypothetical protein